ncbi:DUF58 domain-containing protein [Camelimonas sp. ID_303_24]
MARVRAQAVSVAGLLASGRQGEAAAAPGAVERARALADRLPRIVLEARRVAASVSGVHGRRRAGVGENFWQFRPYAPGESAARIDWRRSGRDDRLHVRQREWEAAQTVWLWANLSSSMGFRSSLAMESKAGRALTLGLGLAGALAQAGERVGLLGTGQTCGGPTALERLAGACALQLRETGADQPDLPPGVSVARAAAIVMVSDFLNPPEALAARIGALAHQGARGHLVLIADPVEESFPFSGQIMLETADGAERLRIGDASGWGDGYRAALARHRAELAAIAARWGWSLTLHRTDRPASEAALRLLTLMGAPLAQHPDAPRSGGSGA